MIFCVLVDSYLFEEWIPIYDVSLTWLKISLISIKSKKIILGILENNFIYQNFHATIYVNVMLYTSATSHLLKI